MSSNSTSWAQLAQAKPAAAPAQATFNFAGPNPNQQLVPANKPAASQAASWGSLAGGGPLAQGGGSATWGGLVSTNPPATPTTSATTVVAQRLQDAPVVPTLGIKPAEAAAQSRNYLSEASKGSGALSVATHEKQMAQVENLIEALVINVSQNLEGLTKLIKRFMEQVYTENEKIGKFTQAITDRATKNDPTLVPDEIVKATAIINFIGAAVKMQESNCDSAINSAKKGSGTVRDETFQAMVNILEIRTRQVQLFASKLQVFQAQDKHQLEMILKVQEADLAAHKEQFAELEKVVELSLKAQDIDHKQRLELRKQQLEEAIQIRSQLLKEQELLQKYEIELAEHELSVQKWNDQHALDVRMQEDKVRMDEKALDIMKKIQLQQIKSQELTKKLEITMQKDVQIHQANRQAQAQMHQVSVQGDVAKHQANRQAQAQMHQVSVQGDVAKHQANRQAEVQHHQVAANLVSSLAPKPCCIQ